MYFRNGKIVYAHWWDVFPHGFHIICPDCLGFPENTFDMKSGNYFLRFLAMI